MLKRVKFGLILLLIINLLSVWSAQAALWINPLSVKQGEIVLVKGLYYNFGNAYSMLSDCQIAFEGKNYLFAREIVDFQGFESSGGTYGFQYTSRIPTTPLTKLGDLPLTLKCPLGQEKFSLKVLSGNFPVQNIVLTSSKNSLSATEKETNAVKNAINTFTPFKLWDSNKPWLAPNKARLSSLYGLRRTYNGVLAQNYFHKGLDFAAFTGNPITAPAKGKFILLGKEKEGFAVHGNCLFIDHGQGIISGYLHLSEFNVIEGQIVEAGEVLGKVGESGIATGPHLHFGVYVNGENVDPDNWLKFAIP